MQTYQILVVEDEDVTRFNLRNLFEAEGYVVFEAVDGSDEKIDITYQDVVDYLGGVLMLRHYYAQKKIDRKDNTELIEKIKELKLMTTTPEDQLAALIKQAELKGLKV